MAENKNANDKLSLTLTRAELFQLYLSVVCRSATATVKWTNATSDDEQSKLQGEIGFLTELTKKLNEVLDNE